MKIEHKNETFIYEDLGFPILLVDCPMKKNLGEWVLNVNLDKLQVKILKALVHKPTSLTSDELRFIRKYFEMTTTLFGEVMGISHAAIVKWESGQNNPNPTTDIYIRLFILEKLSAKKDDYFDLLHEIRPAYLAKKRHLKSSRRPLRIQASKL